MDFKPMIAVGPNPNIPDLAPGDSVEVSAKVVEGGRERTQVYQGVIIRVRRGNNDANFTVRRISHGIGVERTFLFKSPRVEKVVVTRQGKVRRAKLYYLRERKGKSARIRKTRSVKTV